MVQVRRRTRRGAGHAERRRTGHVAVGSIASAWMRSMVIWASCSSADVIIDTLRPSART